MLLKVSDIVPAVTKALARVKLALLIAATVSVMDALSVSDPVPVQPLTVKVLPPAVSVKLAVVNPLRLSDIVPAVSLVLVRVKPALSNTVAVSAVPFSVPLPAQPMMVKVLPPELVSVRLAVVIPVRPSAMPSVEDSEVLLRVKLALLLAATVSVMDALSVSDPVPVQPLTVKVLPPAVSVKLAVVNPLRLSDIVLAVSLVLVRVKPALWLAVTVSPAAALSVSDPVPVQPLTVKVLLPAVSVRLAVLNPLNVNVGRPVTASDVFARTTLLDTLSTRVSVEPLSVPLPVQPVTVKV